MLDGFFSFRFNDLHYMISSTFPIEYCRFEWLAPKLGAKAEALESQVHKT